MIADRVLHTSTTTGTGSYQLVDPTDPLYISAIASVTSGGTFVYSATMGTSWEVCTGVVTAGSPATLTRVLIRSSTGSLINWGAGTKTIASVGQADLMRFGARGQVPTSAGAANVQTLTYATPMVGLRPGMEVVFRPGFANTAAWTLNVNGTGAIAVVTPWNAACAGREVRAGLMTRVVYDGTSWVLDTTAVPPTAIASTSGGAWTLPAGGFWEYEVTGYATAGGTLNTQYAVDVAAGGTVVLAGTAGITYFGKAKRIS